MKNNNKTKSSIINTDFDENDHPSSEYYNMQDSIIGVQDNNNNRPMISLEMTSTANRTTTGGSYQNINNNNINDDDDIDNDDGNNVVSTYTTPTKQQQHQRQQVSDRLLSSSFCEDNVTDASSSSSDDEKLFDPMVAHHTNKLNSERDGLLGPSATYKDQLIQWMYPPDVPIECQLFRMENLVIPSCYLLVGLLQGLSSPLINVLPLDLGATEAQQATVSSIRSLPASFKLLFGFISDIMPINGYRRKPYMLIGWTMASLSLVSLLLFSNLNIPARNSGCFHSSNDYSAANDATDDDGNNNVADDDQINQQQQQDHDEMLYDIGAPTIPFLSLCLLGFGIGFWLADVMGDSIVAEKAKLEAPEHRGSLQSTCYSCRFFGMMVAAPFSTYIYTAFGPYYVVLLLSIMPLTILPLVYIYYEQQYMYVSPVREQCTEIWNTVCSRSVWQPMGFVYLYNILQVGNAAWREFLVTVYNFTSCQLNLILILAYVLLYLGIIAYKYYFIKWSWRNVYIATTILGGFFSLLQVLLIKGITFGLSPFLFTLGDDAFSEFIAGIQFLPTTIMMVHLCPVGSEGASYAMFTTVNNSSLNVSGAISTQLLKIWDVSRTAFESYQFQGMINLTYLTTLLQISAIIFVGLLPRTKEDLIELRNSIHGGTSKIGGIIFLFITLSSILYAILIGLFNIIAPGWMGES